MLQLLQHLVALDHVGQPQRRGAVADAERYLRGGKVLPDKLQHQQLIEVSVQQGADHRIQIPIVVMRPLGKINDHGFPCR